jgi:hypothetical protein
LQKFADAPIVKTMKQFCFVRGKILSAAVLGALILCQVLGVFCTMVSPMPSAEETTFLAQPTHFMPMGNNLCQDLLVSSVSPFKKTSLHVATLSGCVATAGFDVDLHYGDLDWPKHPLKHPPHTKLSVLRI